MVLATTPRQRAVSCVSSGLVAIATCPIMLGTSQSARTRSRDVRLRTTVLMSTVSAKHPKNANIFQWLVKVLAASDLVGREDSSNQDLFSRGDLVKAVGSDSTQSLAFT